MNAMRPSGARPQLLPIAALLLAPGALAAQPLFRGVEVQSTRLGYPPFALTIGDFDEDGLGDIAVTHDKDARLTVVLNDPGGQRTASDALDVGLSPVAVVNGD